jgi:hypothetical protein
MNSRGRPKEKDEKDDELGVFDARASSSADTTRWGSQSGDCAAMGRPKGGKGGGVGRGVLTSMGEGDGLARLEGSTRSETFTPCLSAAPEVPSRGDDDDEEEAGIEEEEESLSR